ncbi:hypothetical protein RSOLAG22IIIB_08059 [Rhizoctonia solani]|uniref:Uncharacterized protein n=1 Tax=Rhizoctonia solani TaxID=456999 RepID=A0A0K6FRR8_9AGAM|nr:hypothetical protein RSOLAG22IIIB_08059 [Rhizoctonia solani]
MPARRNPNNPPRQAPDNPRQQREQPDNGDDAARDLIDRDMSREDLIEFVMRLQLEVNNTKRQLTEVTKERDQLLNNQTRKRRRPAKDNNPTPQDHKYEIAGKRCALFWLLWASVDLYDVELDEDFSEATRYNENEPEKQIQGNRLDMLKSMAENLREGFIAEEHFQQVFRAALGEQRRTSASRVRTYGSRIFGVPQEQFTEPTLRSSNAEFKRLLGFNEEAPDAEPSRKYPRLAPVLYKDGDTTKATGAFRSSFIKQVFRAVLFGPASIDGEGTATRGGNKVLAHVLGAKTTTIGAIAMAAVLTRWAISPDREFKSKGAVTSIQWETDYHQYKRLLYKALEAEAVAFRRRGEIGSYTALVDEWNTEFFPLTREDEPDLRQGDQEGDDGHSDIDMALSQVQDFVNGNN